MAVRSVFLRMSRGIRSFLRTQLYVGLAEPALTYPVACTPNAIRFRSRAEPAGAQNLPKLRSILVLLAAAGLHF